MRVALSASPYEEIELPAWLTPIAMPKEQKCGHHYTLCENRWEIFLYGRRQINGEDNAVSFNISKHKKTRGLLPTCSLRTPKMDL
jgi:hypothetical protein